VQPVAEGIDFNVGCPLGYMLGKKGGVYLQKHPDQLYKIIGAMREAITKSFTVKIRSGWDADSVNAVEVAKELAKLGVDAIAIHARTRKQRYQERADWPLVRKVVEGVDIPVILSGDVTNAYMAYMAFVHTKCDYIMIGRAAKNNPSVFWQLVDWWKDGGQPEKPSKTYDKDGECVNDFPEFLSLYKKRENRDVFTEVRDHALWYATECVGYNTVKHKILGAKSEKELLEIMSSIRF
jgi:tRNA-dihydrouridine synthase